MVNYDLIDKAIKEVLKYEEAAYGSGSMSVTAASDYVEDWYNNTDFTDAQLIAACVMKFHWYTPISYTNALKVKEEYFGG